MLVIFFLLFSYSCKSSPPSIEQEDLEETDTSVLTEESDEYSGEYGDELQADMEGVEEGDEISAEEDTSPNEPDEESGDDLSDETEDEYAMEDMPDAITAPGIPAEEEFEFPEPSLTVPPSPDTGFRQDLPLPQYEAPAFIPDQLPEGIEEYSPEIPPVLEVSPEPEAPPVQELPPALPVPPQPVQPPQAPRPPSSPPSPPPFLRPAEPPSPITPQPAPAPAVPLPDIPSRLVPDTPEEGISFSRIVRVTVGQMIEIPFRGTGWVYLGELGNRRGITYESRRLDISGGITEGQSFIFRAELTGTYILKFYKQDFIQDYIINDHVQIIVGEESEYPGTGRYPINPGRVVAEPRWPPAAENDQAAGSAAGTTAADSAAATRSAEGTAPQGASPPGETIPRADPGRPLETTVAAPETAITPAAPPSAPEIASGTVLPERSPSPGGTSASPQVFTADTPDEYVRRAREEYNAGRIEPALTILDAMRQRYPLGTDEAWWLYGQLLEANSPSRDIRLALEYYRRLVNEYPQSPRAGDAQQRIAYLERYYFNIR